MQVQRSLFKRYTMTILVGCSGWSYDDWVGKFYPMELAKKKGDLPRAKEYAMRTLAADPRNPVALKNLGAIFGKEGDSLKALDYKEIGFEIWRKT